MKHLFGAVIGAALLLGAMPASAEVIVKEKVGVGVGVGVHHNYSHYRHHRTWRSGYAACKVVRTRTRLPNGKIVIRTRKTC